MITLCGRRRDLAAAQAGGTAAMLLLLTSLPPTVAVAAPTTPATPTPALQKLASTLPPPAPRVFLDVASGKDALGRLEFELGAASLLPAHTENVRMLCTGERVGCAYRYLGCFWEAGGAFAAGPRYGFAAELKGAGVGVATAALKLLSQKTMSTFANITSKAPPRRPLATRAPQRPLRR